MAISRSSEVERPAVGRSSLVVKARPPLLLRALAVLAATLAVVVCAVVTFEAGRRLGQGEWRHGVQEMRVLATMVADTEAENERLRREIAALETARGVAQQAQEETRGMLLELEREVQRQREELDFYRTIVSPEDGVAGLRIQSLRVRRAGTDRHYRLQLVLVQAAKHDRPVAGVVDFRVEGVLAGEPRALTARELEGAPAAPDPALAFSFRYFTDLEQGIELPPDFIPDRVVVEVSPDGDPERVVRRTFDWATIS